MGWIGVILAGGLAGWIAEKIMKFDTGLIMNIVLGICGAILMNFLLGSLMGVVFAGFIGQMIMGIAGACVLIYGYRMIKARG